MADPGQSILNMGQEMNPLGGLAGNQFGGDSVLGLQNSMPMPSTLNRVGAIIGGQEDPAIAAQAGNLKTAAIIGHLKNQQQEMELKKIEALPKLYEALSLAASTVQDPKAREATAQTFSRAFNQAGAAYDPETIKKLMDDQTTLTSITNGSRYGALVGFSKMQLIQLQRRGAEGVGAAQKIIQQGADIYASMLVQGMRENGFKLETADDFQRTLNTMIAKNPTSKLAQDAMLPHLISEKFYQDNGMVSPQGVARVKEKQLLEAVTPIKPSEQDKTRNFLARALHHDENGDPIPFDKLDEKQQQAVEEKRIKLEKTDPQVVAGLARMEGLMMARIGVLKAERTTIPVDPKTISNYFNINAQTPQGDKKFSGVEDITPSNLRKNGYRYIPSEVAPMFRMSILASTQIDRMEALAHKIYDGVEPGMNLVNALALKSKRGLGEELTTGLNTLKLETIPAMGRAAGLVGNSLGEKVMQEIELPMLPGDRDTAKSLFGKDGKFAQLKQRLINNRNIAWGSGVPAGSGEGGTSETPAIPSSGGLREGSTGPSKSGKPMTVRNGQWTYD